jgi:ketosteroid isomerase-like protein
MGRAGARLAHRLKTSNACLLATSPKAIGIMNEVLRSRLQSLSSAYAQGKLEFVANFIDEHIDFISYAPVSVFPCLGKQRGKAAVAKSLETIHAHFELHAYKPVLMVVEADDAAVIIQARATQRATGRVIQLLLAQFLRFRDGRIVELREFMDSFDAVEQVLGREIDL